MDTGQPPSVQAFSPFAPTAAYSAATNGGSGYFDGTGDYLSVADNAAVDMGASDFTIECFVYLNETPSSADGIFAKRTNNTAFAGVLIYLNGTTVNFFATLNGSSWGVSIASSIALSLYSWNHLAFTRNSNTWTLWVNGVSKGTATVSGTVPDNSSAFVIGAASSDGNATNLFPSGYISDPRIVKGTAVYTSSFTPPTAPLTAITMKKLILSVFFAALIAASTTQAAPVLNSFPTATATLYLDFDGHDVNSSMWNYGTPFTCLPAAMTDLQITEAFNRVSEDFRPFNINVTTDLNKFLAAPLSMRVRIVVTPTSAWYPGVAGIAYVGSFTWGDDTPAFVFSDKLSNDAKRVAEAISHESGHTVGLYHQSSYTAECAITYTYNPGNGIGETSWGPIMGSAASKNATQWNYGPTPNGCTILQDNLSVITTSNGFGFRADDYADVNSSAIAINVPANIFSVNGIISTTNDKDIFRFDLGQNGQFRMKVNPYSVGANNSGANLDVRIILQNATGATIATYDYTDSLHAKMDTTLNAGTYYVVIS